MPAPAIPARPPAPGNRLLLAIRRSVIVRWTTLRSAGWSVLQRGHDAVCRPRYPISPGSTDAPFALLEWPSDDPERVSVPAGLTPFDRPRGPVSHAAVLTRWLRPGSLGHRAFPSVARDNPTAGNDVSVTPAFRQAVRAGERGTGVHVPGPPCNRSGGHERAVRRVCAADVRCAGWLRSADPPALPRGSRPRFGRQQWVVCCARRGLAHVAASATSAPSRPAVNRTCSHPAIAVPTGRRSAVAAPYGKCGEITYSYRQLQTPVGLRRLRNRSFGHGIRAPGP